MAQLYSQLYFSGSFTELRLDEYLSKIAAPLVDLVGPANITLDSAMQAVTVPVRLVAVLGLIVTELITNAIKYAFPGGRKGTIRLSLRKTVAGALLVIGDDGVGFPAASIPVPGSDIGLTIVRGLTMVRGLATQIDGAFEITQAADGTRCVLEFPIGNGSSDPGKDLVHDRV